MLRFLCEFAFGENIGLIQLNTGRSQFDAECLLKDCLEIV